MFIPNNKILDSKYPTENNYFYGFHAWTLTVNKTKVNYFVVYKVNIPLFFLIII